MANSVNDRHLVERPKYMSLLQRTCEQHLIKVVSGVRRCGKSTLLEMFADSLISSGCSSEQIQLYNFEDPDIFSLGDWKQVYDHINNKLIPGKMNYVFLDEVQNIQSFERLVDGLFIKKNCDVYITGSNAYLLSGELATLLTGRYFEIPMTPFSFVEYSSFLASNVHSVKNTENPLKLSKTESFADFLYYGGIPEANNLILNGVDLADTFVRGVFNTIIEKDIYERNRIHNKPAFQKIVDFSFDNIGSMVSPTSIANTLTSMGTKIDNETAAVYLSYLADVLLLYRVPRYEIKGKGLLQTLDKYYVVDPAFRRVRLGKKSGSDIGHLLENAVYFELCRRYPSVRIGKLKDMEVDFVVVDSEGYTSYYQVAYQAMDGATLERELMPLRAIKDSSPKYLLTMDIDNNPVFDGIRKLNVVDWMLDDSL